MNFTSLILGLAASLVGSLASAEALVRVTPRNDYGNQSSAFGRIKDRWDQKGALVQGQAMGGDYDVVMEKDVANNQIEVLRCPTAKACFETVPGEQANCLATAKYWQCETLYKDSSSNFCRHYAVGHRAQAVVHFLGDQVLGGLITGQFAFFQKGIGLAATRVSTGFSAYNALKTVVTTECRPDAPATTVAEGNATTVRNVKVFTELEKGEVRNFIELFTPHKSSSNSESALPYEENLYPQARAIQLN